jgi:hypothetical protein
MLPVDGEDKLELAELVPSPNLDIVLRMPFLGFGGTDGGPCVGSGGGGGWGGSVEFFEFCIVSSFACKCGLFKFDNDDDDSLSEEEVAEIPLLFKSLFSSFFRSLSSLFSFLKKDIILMCAFYFLSIVNSWSCQSVFI